MKAGNTNGGSITVPLTSCSTGLDVLQIKTKIVSIHTADSKSVKQEVNGTVIILPLVFPDEGHEIKACWGEGAVLISVTRKSIKMEKVA